MSFRNYDELTIGERDQAYCAICYYSRTNLTNSIYVLGCENSISAEKLSYDYFKDKSKNQSVFINEIRRIEILPKGYCRYDNVDVCYHKNYVL